FAIGVNELYGKSKQYEWFKQFKPIDRIGYSIYIYHITLEDANRVRREMGLPEIETTTSKQKQTKKRHERNNQNKKIPPSKFLILLLSAG
ncbi:MAG: hypothetical protein LBT05_01505, partial [Planctomycetaceae bacterium]|nr:hypothetical protein [Planctomycetaceae bacterium]